MPNGRRGGSRPHRDPEQAPGVQDVHRFTFVQHLMCVGVTSELEALTVVKALTGSGSGEGRPARAWALMHGPCITGAPLRVAQPCHTARTLPPPAAEMLDDIVGQVNEAMGALHLRIHKLKYPVGTKRGGGGGARGSHDGVPPTRRGASLRLAQPPAPPSSLPAAAAPQLDDGVWLGLVNTVCGMPAGSHVGRDSTPSLPPPRHTPDETRF